MTTASNASEKLFGKKNSIDWRMVYRSLSVTWRTFLPVQRRIFM